MKVAWAREGTGKNGNGWSGELAGPTVGGCRERGKRKGRNKD